MATYEQAKYCPNCKKNVSADKDDRCKICGGKVKKSLWSVRFRIIENGIEKQKRLSGYNTKREAVDAYVNFINTHKNNSPKKELTFYDLFNEYERYIKNRNKPSTHYDFVKKTQKHILPFFKDFLVEDITPKNILDWQNSIDNYSYQYKTNLRNCLSGMLRFAEKYHKIQNQLHEVDNFRNLEFKQEMQIWTPEEFNAVMNYIDDPIYKTLYYALFYTGARKGEILATKWKDWNLNTQTLNIDKSISKKVTGASWILTTPKNASSNRKIKVPPFLIEMIQELHKKALQENLKGDFVFYGDKPLPETSICRNLKRATSVAGIKDIRIHDFRHSHASLLISEGAPIVAVAKRLGHSNIEQTLNTYAHMMPTDEDAILSILKRTNLSEN